MKTLQRKAPLLGIIALLLGGGVLMGALASSLTTDALVWHQPATIPVTDAPIATPVDQAGAGQGWARTAFDGGLRECPKINAEFLAACEAEMKKLAERPDFSAGSYGGPLLITKVVEPDRVDDGWDAQDRLETPPPPPDLADYEALPAPAPTEPPFERTPDNYPAAAPSLPVTIADGTAPPTGR